METLGDVGRSLELVGQGGPDSELGLPQVEVDLTVATGVGQQSVRLDLTVARGGQDWVGFLRTKSVRDQKSCLLCHQDIKDRKKKSSSIVS